MIRNVLVDTGPLVALLNRHEHFHAWAKEQAAHCESPLATCEAVLTEACYLLREIDGGSERLMDLIRRGLLVLPFLLRDDHDSVSALMRRYSDVPMSLADACLVRMSEQVSGSTVFTLDNDFRIYRQHGRRAIPLLIPKRA